MALKTFNPVTPSLREHVAVDRSDLWKGGPCKPLTSGLTKSGGRNHHGRLTARRRGGGHKRLYRLIDFKRQIFDTPAEIVRIEYDPNRTCYIALVQYQGGDLSYILAPQKLKVGDSVIAGEKVDIKPGNALRLKNIPVGTVIHNVEFRPGGGGKFARAAGAEAQVVGRDAGYVQVRLCSGEVRLVQGMCMATVGALSNPDQKNINLGKAGRSRWLGFRPSVRGVAMNPVDHPHGGGEGRTSGGRHPVTPWGKPTKGRKTRSKRKSNSLIVRRRTK